MNVKRDPGSMVLVLGTFSEGGNATITRRDNECDNGPLAPIMVTLKVLGVTCNAERLTIICTDPFGTRIAVCGLADIPMPAGIEVPVKLTVPEKSNPLATVSFKLREPPGASMIELVLTEIVKSPMNTRICW